MRDRDFPQVLELWQACFGDEEAYVRFFWENGFPLGRGLLMKEDGRTVSMLFLLPGALAQSSNFLPAEYVYAVATLPEYRGRGYAAELVRSGAEMARSQKTAALCLLPANPSLYDYYAKLGFVKGFRAQSFQNGYQPPLTPPLEHEFMQHEIMQEIMCRKRDAVWSRLGYFAWPPPLLAYMQREHVFTGGEVYADAHSYAFLNADGSVKERSLCRPTTKPGGMLLPLDPSAEGWLASTGGKAYLGFPLN